MENLKFSAIPEIITKIVEFYKNINVENSSTGVDFLSITV